MAKTMNGNPKSRLRPNPFLSLSDAWSRSIKAPATESVRLRTRPEKEDAGAESAMLTCAVSHHWRACSLLSTWGREMQMQMQPPTGLETGDWRAEKEIGGGESTFSHFSFPCPNPAFFFLTFVSCLTFSAPRQNAWFAGQHQAGRLK